MVADATLVVVDMQEAFRRPDSGWYTVGYEDAAARVTDLLPRFSGRTVWTRFVRDSEEHGAWRDYYDRWREFRVPRSHPDWNLTLTPSAEDPILTRPTFGKWDEELASLTEAAPNLVVCGVATDCCVLSTVLGAVDAGRSVTVVTDACAGATTEVHEQALAVLGLLSPMVTLTTSGQLVS